MEKSSFVKKLISLLLASVILATSVNFIDSSVYAEIRSTAYTAMASASNSLNRLSLTATQSECEHNYVFERVKNGNPNCTKSGNVIYKCTYCGATETRYTALGHHYAYTSESFGTFTYRCKYCSEVTTAHVYDLLNVISDSINCVPARNNSNCLLDVACDGIINARDLARLKQSEATVTPTTLINKKSNETTKQVYRYLCDMYGKATLSAQQESTWVGGSEYEINYIYNNTGKYPAIRGLDYMNDDFSGVNSRATQWWNNGGLVTICWHTGSNFCGEWNNAMNDTVSDWTAMLTEDTAEYNQMLAGMDKAASALLQLQNNGVTVLWRPFHEFDGAWFWWGKGGSANFKKLWKIMYDRYTNYWGLNNLIWVLGYSHNGTNMSSWNPGNAYYDIIGVDTYSSLQFPTLYSAVSSIAARGKPIVLHECGKNPTVASLTKYPYGYFMTWHTTYLTDDNTTEDLSTLYNSERVITRDELNFRSY